MTAEDRNGEILRIGDTVEVDTGILPLGTSNRGEIVHMQVATAGTILYIRVTANHGWPKIEPINVCHIKKVSSKKII